MASVTLEIRDEWLPLLIGAHKLINQVMEAGLAQRGTEEADDGWMKLNPVERVRRMFMHLVATQTHMSKQDNPWSLTENTALEDYKHATMGGIIVFTRLEVLPEPEPKAIEVIEE